MPVVSSGQITITDVNDSPAITLSSESAVVPAGQDGSSPDLTWCTTTLAVRLGNLDDSDNWAVSATPSLGVVGNLSGRTYSVTGFTADAGYVDFVASRAGWPSLEKRFSITKSKRGETGPTFRLTASAPGFRFVDGAPAPADQAILFSVARYGVTGPVTFTVEGVTGAPLLNADGMLSGIGAAFGAPLTHGDDEAYLDVSSMGDHQRLVVRAACGDYFDTVTVVRLSDSADTAIAAYAAVFDPVNGLDRRLKANADNVLGGILSADATSVPVGLRVGTVTWDAAGTPTSGSGVAITPKGVYARNASQTTFVLDATTGNATFSGSLTGANITGSTGVFSGSLTVESLGTLAQEPVTVTATGGVTVPDGCTMMRYELVGGGAGGGGGGANNVAGYGGGGGSGGYMAGTMSVTPGASVSVVIGSGGAGGGTGANGGAGVASTINGVVSAAGGSPGAGSGTGFGAGGAAGFSSTGASTPGLAAALDYDGVNTTHDGFGRYDGRGTYGLGFPSDKTTGSGGSNPLGTGAVGVKTGVGAVGLGYGSGGSGGGQSLITTGSSSGGAGRPGLAILTFYNPNGVVLQTQLDALKAALTSQGIAVA